MARTFEVTVYKFDELSDEAKERARKWWRDAAQEDTWTLDEMAESLKAVFKAAGIKLTDWELGAYTYRNRVEFDMGDAGKLKGRRAVAWLENNLFSQFRGKLGGMPECPLTGVCWDEDFFDSLREETKSGATLQEAFAGLAEVLREKLEAQIEYENETEQVDESLRANDYEFTKDGETV